MILPNFKDLSEKNSVKLQIAFRVFLIFSTLSLISSIAFSYYKLSDVKRLMDERSSKITDYIYLKLNYSDSISTLQRSINYLGPGTDVEDVIVLDQDQNVISSNRLGQDVEKIREKFTSLSLEQELNIRKINWGQQKSFHKITADINNRARISRATIYLILDAKSVIQRAIFELAVFILLMSLIFLLVIFIIFRSLKVEIFDPLNYVVDYCSAFGKGLDVDMIPYDKEDEIGTIYKLLNVMVLDIRAQRQSLVQEREKAEIASHTKGRFVANMSHEMRTPLNAIIGFSDLLLREELSKECLELSSNISTSGKLLLSIINDVLDFSKIEEGKLELESVETSLLDIVETVVLTAEIAARDKDIKVVVDCANKDVIFISDQFRLNQVLLNLLNNAIKFTSHGEVKLSVFSKINNGRVFIDMSVTDTGIGISEENLNKLFRPFEQVDKSDSRKYGGSGLGLVISKNILNLMGSDLNVTSSPGVGSCFYFSIECPFVKEQKRSLERKDVNVGGIESLKSFNVLLVEDNKINQKVFTKYLGKMGLSARVVDNGKAAVEILREEDFDLVFMDIQMPIMDGLEATMHIRETLGLRDVLICGLSANAFVGDKNKALEVGMNYYLEKPLTFEKLQSFLKEIS